MAVSAPKREPRRHFAGNAIANGISKGKQEKTYLIEFKTRKCCWIYSVEMAIPGEEDQGKYIFWWEQWVYGCVFLQVWDF